MNVEVTLHLEEIQPISPCSRPLLPTGQGTDVADYLRLFFMAPALLVLVRVFFLCVVISSVSLDKLLHARGEVA